jgi:hypothetical protein
MKLLALQAIRNTANGVLRNYLQQHKNFYQSQKSGGSWGEYQAWAELYALVRPFKDLKLSP